MKIAKPILFALTAFAFAFASSADAEDKKKESGSAQVAAAGPSFQLPQYVPPAGGRPARTVGGASRGSEERIPALYVLVPDHVGKTVSAQPSLYWFISGAQPSNTKLMLTLIDEDSDEPNLEKTLSRPSKAGIYSVDLADYGFDLKPDTEYEWSVSLLVDPNEPAKDIVATGWISRVGTSAELKQALAADKSDANAYASQGIWYDALAAAEGPSRSALLKQVGLDVPAGAN